MAPFGQEKGECKSRRSLGRWWPKVRKGDIGRIGVKERELGEGPTRSAGSVLAVKLAKH